MKVMFLDAPYSKEIKLCEEVLDYIKEKGYTKLGLYGSVQFSGKLEEVEKQLAEINVEVITSKPDRSSTEKQLLGCTIFEKSLNLDREVDAYLYIGDGKFHPLSLVYMQKNSNTFKEVICNNPIEKKMMLLGLEDIKKNLQRYKAGLMKFLSAEKIGVIITIKPGQEQFLSSLKLENKYPDKKFYYFVDDNVSFNQLENFPFIELWVNTACPRIALDDQEKFNQRVLNLNDALETENLLSHESVINK